MSGPGSSEMLVLSGSPLQAYRTSQVLTIVAESLPLVQVTQLSELQLPVSQGRR